MSDNQTQHSTQSSTPSKARRSKASATPAKKGQSSRRANIEKLACGMLSGVLGYAIASSDVLSQICPLPLP